MMHLSFGIFIEILKRGSADAGPRSRVTSVKLELWSHKAQHRIPSPNTDYRKLPRLARNSHMESQALEFSRPKSWERGHQSFNIARIRLPFQCRMADTSGSEAEARSLLGKHLHPQAPNTYTPWVAMGVNCKAVSWVLQPPTYASVLSNSAAI